MLLRNRIIFALRDLVGHRAGILLGHIEIARVGRRQQLDLDGCGLRHDGDPLSAPRGKAAAKSADKFSRLIKHA